MLSSVLIPTPNRLSLINFFGTLGERDNVGNGLFVTFPLNVITVPLKSCISVNNVFANLYPKLSSLFPTRVDISLLIKAVSNSCFVFVVDMKSDRFPQALKQVAISNSVSLCTLCSLKYAARSLKYKLILSLAIVIPPGLPWPEIDIFLPLI